MSSTFFISLALAQNYIPSVVMMPVHSFEDTKALYISGGVAYRGKNNGQDLWEEIKQTFTIDLSVSWSAINPVYKELSSIGGPLAPMTSTLSPDGRNLFVVGTDHRIYNLNLDTNSWIHSDWNGNDTFTADVVVAAATDPNTGTVFLPGGYTDNGKFRMSKTAHGSKNVPVALPMYPGSDKPYGSSRLAAWSVAWQGMIEFNEDTGEFHSYGGLGIRNDEWSKLNTTGPAPGPRMNSCLVPAYGGTKMVMFGGLRNNKSLRDVRILDLANLRWTRGTDVPPGNARDGMACAVSYDSLIVWGGIDSNSLKVTEKPLVYNIATNKWVDSYVAELMVESTSMPAPTSTPTDATTSASADKQQQQTVILASVLSVLLVSIAIAGLVVFRRYRRSHPRLAEHTGIDLVDPRNASAAGLTHGFLHQDDGGSHLNEFVGDEQYPTEIAPPSMMSYSRPPTPGVEYPLPPPSVHHGYRHDSLQCLPVSGSTNSQSSFSLQSRSSGSKKGPQESTRGSNHASMHPHTVRLDLGYNNSYAASESFYRPGSSLRPPQALADENMAVSDGHTDSIYGPQQSGYHPNYQR